MFAKFSVFLAGSLSLVAQEPVVLGSEYSLQERLESDLVVSELGCAACHDRTADWKAGPLLGSVGERVSAQYLRDYIARPHTQKPGTTMPDLLATYSEEEKDEIAGAIVDYLLEGQEEPLEFQPVDGEAVERGRALYTSVGCAACHDVEDKALPHSSPLVALTEKYSVKGLTEFLEDPLAIRPSGRMPDMGLTHWEAEDLASYLLREQTPPKQEEGDSVVGSRAKEGKEHFMALGCAQCHEPESAREDFAKIFADLSLTESCSQAHYSLSEEQQKKIAAYGATSEKLATEDAIQLKMAQMNCYACHSRDDIGGVPAERDSYFTTQNLNLGDQARIPPRLDGVGAKLKEQALRRILNGKGAVRPYMDTRMPRFGADNVDVLVSWLGEADHLELQEISRFEPKNEAGKIGHQLVGEKGLACNACHTFFGEKSTTLDALDLTVMHQRLQEGWFHRYLRNPQKFHSTTIMPGFWPEGRSVRPEILGGDADQQIDAIWQYLAKGKEARRPVGVRPDPIPYGPSNGEAVMLRRQYRGIGKRGIGVGYPSGINLAFDAGKMSLGTIWKGDFAEMSAVWRGQGSGFVKAAGDGLVNFPAGPSLAKLESLQSDWPVVPEAENAPGFRLKGYTVDKQQRPTFRYEFAGVEVLDHFLDSAEGPSLARTLSFSQPVPEGIYFRIAREAKLEAVPGKAHSWKLSNGLVVTSSAPATVVVVGEEEELRLSLSGLLELKLSYQYLGL